MPMPGILASHYQLYAFVMNLVLHSEKNVQNFKLPPIKSAMFATCIIATIVFNH